MQYEFLHSEMISQRDIHRLLAVDSDYALIKMDFFEAEKNVLMMKTLFVEELNKKFDCQIIQSK